MTTYSHIGHLTMDYFWTRSDAFDYEEFAVRFHWSETQSGAVGESMLIAECCAGVPCGVKDSWCSGLF